MFEREIATDTQRATVPDRHRQTDRQREAQHLSPKPEALNWGGGRSKRLERGG